MGTVDVTVPVQGGLGGSKLQIYTFPEAPSANAMSTLDSIWESPNMRGLKRDPTLKGSLI